MRSSVARATVAFFTVILVAACGGRPGASPPPGTSTAPPTSVPLASPSTAATPSPTPDPAASGWTSAGSAAAYRVGHTATLLQDGRVLVVGGLDVEGAEAAGVEIMARTSAELYDPRSGTWSATASMAVGRASHSATRLADGSVLVAGGGKEDDAAARSVERYDPETGQWSSLPSLSVARAGHAAFPMPDGGVLVVGGVGLGSDPVRLTSAERYDPATGTWLAVAEPSDSGAGQVGLVLADGRVLLIQHGFNAPATSAIYDPAAGTWRPSSSMGEPRHGFPLALLPGGRVLAPGGGVGMVDGVLAAAQVFDPATESWQDTGSMAFQRQAFTATAIPDGRVAAIGGGGADDAGARSAELYDPVTGTWSAAPSMVDPRFGHTATLLGDGSILVVGGYIGGGAEALASAERFIPPGP